MKPCRVNQPYLSRALSAAQSRQLRRWLLVEEITYAAARQRLKQQFGITASNNQVSKFYHRNIAPAPALSQSARLLALDLRISRDSQGMRFLLVERIPGVRVTVNGRKMRPGIFHHSSP